MTVCLTIEGEELTFNPDYIRGLLPRPGTVAEIFYQKTLFIITKLIFEQMNSNSFITVNEVTDYLINACSDLSSGRGTTRQHVQNLFNFWSESCLERIVPEHKGRGRPSYFYKFNDSFINQLVNDEETVETAVDYQALYLEEKNLRKKLEGRIIKLKSDHKALKDDSTLADLKLENDLLINEIKGYEAKVKELKEERRGLKKKVSSLKDKLSKDFGVITVKEKVIVKQIDNELIAQFEALQDKYKSLESDYQSLVEENERLRNRKVVQISDEQLADERSKLGSKVGFLETRIRQLESMLGAEFNDKGQVIGYSLTKRLKAYEKEVIRLNKQHEFDQKNFTRLTIQRNLAEKENKGLRDDLERLKGNIKQLQDDLLEVNFYDSLKE